KYEILLGHGGDEQHIPIRRSTFTGTEFDYIALGHIHRQQDIVPNHIIYAGSMEPTDKNDTGHHGFVRGEITEAGVRAVFVPYAKREYLHLVLPVDEKTTLHSLQDLISEVILKRGRQHMYRFLLRGERAMELEFPVEMKENYDNVLEIVDETEPALDMDRIYTENRNNLIGKYMEMFDYCEKDSVEYQALYEGLLALLK
ncbi:MAG: DNA repair exonuclease, partial [Ruminococcus sp.]|nr:DNA repair exonuclease [Ruminococcus sp.]